MEVFERAVLPDDLDEVPPGPDLARVLAGVDRSRCGGDDLVSLLRARNRQLAHEQAQLLADMVEMAQVGMRSRWGDFLSEGIVARPATEIRARNGRRIITKVKTKDFA